MKSPAPRAIGELLLSAMPQLSARLTGARIQGAWPSIVGDDVARRARPVSLVGAQLHVVVDNSPWLSELTLRAEELTGAVRERFPEVATLRFTLGALPGTGGDPSPAPPPPAPPLTDADRRDIDAAVGAIADPTLAAAARRLMIRARRFSARGPSR